MRMGFGLNVEQTQKLIMTPELRQAITILQLSSLELENYIEQQLQENPLLELRDDRPGPESEPAETNEAKDKEQEQEYDIDWKEYFHDSSDIGVPHQSRSKDQEEYTFENFVSRPPTLVEHLSFQLQLANVDDEEFDIGEYIIGNIDHNGYLQVAPEDMAEHLLVPVSKVLDVLDVIQGFDPAGVGARTLQECLMLQVRQMGLKDELVEQIISRHLNDVAKGKYAQLAQLLGVAVQEIQRVADLLKTLDPKPGRNFFSPNDNRYITPDVVVEKVDGEYIILVNDCSSMPRLTINSAYRSVLNEGNTYDSKTKRFVESRLNAATWLIRSIEQRRLTLYKVASCLVELQTDFLEYGVKYLKPLNLRKVAEIVGLHESTVSRATSNKYIQTPQGVFEMKFFFSSGLSGSSGNMVSAQSIKKMLQELIDSEDPSKPLNDQRISEIFAERGTKISRRTVAKYRDELGIPPIRKRKRY
jgi:RNA polymerase sigma-54 factor